jgi:hypothetical protein
MIVLKSADIGLVVCLPAGRRLIWLAGWLAQLALKLLTITITGQKEGGGPGRKRRRRRRRIRESGKREG